MTREELFIDITVQRGDFQLRAECSIGPGEVLGVIGPNGAGKSSLVGAIAGTVAISHGEVRMGADPLTVQANTRSAGVRQVHVPRAERRIAHLEQRARLFPHLNARENVAFGPRARGETRRSARSAADEWLAQVGLPDRGDARPHELSGGQQQRVALARSLNAQPRAVLLDEPFAALDVSSAAAIRSLIRAQLRRLRVPTVLVTHDPIDLMALADRVLVLEHGEARQLGSVTEVLGRPGTPFAANFSGKALLRGFASGDNCIRLPSGPLARMAGIGELPDSGAPAIATYHPGDVIVSPTETDATTPPNSATRPHAGAAPQSWVDQVASITPVHSGVRITGVRWPECIADLTLDEAVALRLSEGMSLKFCLPREFVQLSPDLPLRGKEERLLG